VSKEVLMAVMVRLACYVVMIVSGI